MVAAMRRFFRLSCQVLSLAFLVPASLTARDGSAEGAFGNKRALIIGIDGLRPDALQAGDTPNLDALIAAGAVSYDGYSGGELGTPTQQTTMSGPGWAAILTGVWKNKHGIKDNSFNGKKLDAYPHFYRRISEVNPAAALASIVNWAPIDSQIVSSAGDGAVFRLTQATDAGVADQAAAYLAANDPDVMFLHFDEVDGAGHKHGYGVDKRGYMDSVRDVDAKVGQVVDAVRARPNHADEDWLFLVVTDHGGTGTSHGGQSPGERDIFIIASGGGVARQVVSPGPGIVAVPPTVMKHLGAPVDPDWGWEAEPFGWPVLCLGGLSAEADQKTRNVTLGWAVPVKELKATGVRVLRDGVLAAELPPDATSWTDTAVEPTDSNVKLRYKVHAVGGEAGSCPVREVEVFFYPPLDPSGLVAYYSFDGDDLTDNAAAIGGGPAKAAAWTGAANYKNGCFGRAAVVGDGAGSNYITASGDEFDFDAEQSFTVTFWVNVGKAVGGDPVLIAGGGKNWSASGVTRGWVSAMLNGDDVKANIADGANRADTAGIDLDHDEYWAGQGLPGEHWNFVALVVDRGGKVLTNYVADDWVPANSPFFEAGVSGHDFGPDSSAPATADISRVGDVTGGNTALVIGQDGDGAGYALPATGVDDLSVWRRALSRAEVWQIYAEGRANRKPLAAVLSDGRRDSR